MTLTFNERYFRSRQMLEDSGHLHQIAVRIKEFFSPLSVLDVGCGVGWVVKHLQEEGVEGTRGIDISKFGVSNKVTDDVSLSCFTEEEGKYDVVIASKLLQCLSDKEVKQFADWSLEHCTNHLLILNSPGEGEERTRTTEHYERIFIRAGWVKDKKIQRQLQEATSWDCLVLMQFPPQFIHRPQLTPKQRTTSLIIDCWAGNDALSEGLDHVRQLLLFEAELTLVNAERCSSLPDHLAMGETKGQFLLKGTQLRVESLEGVFRSTSEAFREGLRACNSPVAVFLQVQDRLSPTFVPSAVSTLLKHPSASYVTPTCFAVAEDGSRWDFKVDPHSLLQFANCYGCGCKLLTAEVSIFAASLPFWLFHGDRNPDCISPFAAFRTSEILSQSVDADQLVFAVPDMLLECAHNGGHGVVDPDLFGVTSHAKGRFSDGEIESAKVRLLERRR